jgi:DNA-binding transcriptional LysR family regulator
VLAELKSFVLLAETGSVQAVAERLPLTQPAVTRHLQRLESMLETTLLDRRVKPATLTPAGQALLKKAKAILGAVEELKQAASSDAEPEGVLRIGVAHALAEPTLAGSLTHLGASFPRISLHLVSGWTADLLAQLDRGELDAALVFGAGEAARLPHLPGKLLASEALVMLASRHLPLPKRPTIADLNIFGWVLTPDGMCGSRSALRQAVEKAGAEFRIAAEVHDVGLQASLVERGLGIGLMPKRRAQQMRRPSLRTLVLPGLDLGMAVSLARGPYPGRLGKALDSLERDLCSVFRGEKRLASGK